MKSHRPLPTPSEKEVNDWLDCLFASTPLADETQFYEDAIIAFQNLTAFFICSTSQDSRLPVSEFLAFVRFDHVGLMSMLRRFQRDAYGLSHFSRRLEESVKRGELTRFTKRELLDQASRLGLRIAAVEPRKTRIVAAFSLWMSVFRPVTFDSQLLTWMPVQDMELFCASLNFFIASTYLNKFGRVALGDQPDEITALVLRIKYDLTHRNVSLESLVSLYSSIFRQWKNPPSTGSDRKHKKLQLTKTNKSQGVPVSLKVVSLNALSVSKEKPPAGAFEFEY